MVDPYSGTLVDFSEREVAVGPGGELSLYCRSKQSIIDCVDPTADIQWFVDECSKCGTFPTLVFGHVADAAFSCRRET